MSPLETVSKRAAIVSLVAIIAAQLMVHPDLTWPLRALAIAAFAVGWWAGPRRDQATALWLLIAPFVPALLRLAAGREGPVLDFAWMAGLSAAVIRSVPPGRWNLPDTWRPLAAGWALMVAFAWPVLVGREIGFDLNLLRDQGAINSSGLLSAPQAAAWIMYVAWMHLLGLLWLDWACGRFRSAPEAIPQTADALWIGTTLTAFVAIYQGLVNLTFLNTTFWAAQARATGMMLDANAYGMCAAIAGPLGFALLRARGRTPLGAAVLLVNLASVWMSGSRTAALCALIGTVAILLALWNTVGIESRRPLVITAAASAVVLAALFFAAGASGPVRRLAELPDSPTRALSDVFTRGPYGTTALRILEDYPASGVGIGSYQLIAPDYWRQLADNMLPFDTAQNWWRHQATELGLIGALTLFAWSALIAWMVISAPARPEQRAVATIVRGVIVAIGVTSFTHMPTQTPLVLLAFLYLLGWFAVALRAPHADAPRWLTGRGAWIAATSLALIYVGAHAALARGRLDVVERARQAHREYIVGTYPPEHLPDATTFRWTGKHARIRLPAGGPWLVVRMWAHHPDATAEPVAVVLSTECGTVTRQELRGPDPVSIWMRVPDEQKWVDVSLDVSRTWRPADYRGTDRRALGVGMVADFAPRVHGMSERRAFTLPRCSVT